MSPGTLILAIVLALVLIGIVARELLTHRPRHLTASSQRIVFPFVAQGLSQRGLDAALRLARNEDATLVPVFLARVPMHLPLDTALPRECDSGLPLLELVEQRALTAGIPVDARIERGRTLRHALQELADHERFDTMVVAAVDATEAGFHPDDIGWLLAHVDGEIIVIRAGDRVGVRPRGRRGKGRRRQLAQVGLSAPEQQGENGSRRRPPGAHKPESDSSFTTGQPVPRAGSRRSRRTSRPTGTAS
ncbi:MAG: hypothetical protein ABSC56_00485 [Solirubrobacteraceae bacterium]|jgi:hypothetical protein